MCSFLRQMYCAERGVGLHPIQGITEFYFESDNTICIFMTCVLLFTLHKYIFYVDCKNLIF